MKNHFPTVILILAFLNAFYEAYYNDFSSLKHLILIIGVVYFLNSSTKKQD